MKKQYITPAIIVELIETECNFLELSNQKTNSSYGDIPGGLLDGNGNYQEGDGEDAGAKKGGFFNFDWDD